MFEVTGTAHNPVGRTAVQYRDAAGNPRQLTVKAIPAGLIQAMEGLVNATGGAGRGVRIEVFDDQHHTLGEMYVALPDRAGSKEARSNGQPT